MKRFLICATALILIFCAWAFAADKTVPPLPAKAAPSGTAAAAVTKMRAPGTILEITDSRLIIERKVKDNVETMEFVLEKPMKFRAGDKVRITYIEDKGRRIVTRIIKLSDLIEKKPVRPAKEIRPATGSAAPAAK